MLNDILRGFFDEFSKIAATVLMPKLSPAAKGFMDRMTGVTHGASIPQPKAARQLRGALTGAKSPELMTEMHGMRGMLSPTEQQAKAQARQHFEGVLQNQGRVYQGAPNLSQQLQNIGGHPGQLTRTGTKMVPQPQTAMTSAGLPSAQKRPMAIGTASTQMAPVNATGATMMAQGA